MGLLKFAWSVDQGVIFDTFTLRKDILCVRDAEMLNVMVHILTILLEVLSIPYLQR